MPAIPNSSKAGAIFTPAANGTDNTRAQVVNIIDSFLNGAATDSSTGKPSALTDKVVCFDYADDLIVVALDNSGGTIQGDHIIEIYRLPAISSGSTAANKIYTPAADGTDATRAQVVNIIDSFLNGKATDSSTSAASALTKKVVCFDYADDLMVIALDNTATTIQGDYIIGFMVHQLESLLFLVEVVPPKVSLLLQQMAQITLAHRL